MPKKFWYTIIKSVDKTKVHYEWKKLVRREMKTELRKFVVRLLKKQEVIDDDKFKIKRKRNKKGPRQRAEQYPLYYIKLGQDNRYYIRTKANQWEKITTKTVKEPLRKGRIAYSLGYIDDDNYAIYKYMDLPKKITRTHDVINFIKKEQKHWDKGMAVEFKGLTIIGGYLKS